MLAEESKTEEPILDLAKARDEAMGDKPLGKVVEYLGRKHMVMESGGRRFLMSIQAVAA